MLIPKIMLSLPALALFGGLANAKCSTICWRTANGELICTTQCARPISPDLRSSAPGWAPNHCPTSRICCPRGSPVECWCC